MYLRLSEMWYFRPQQSLRRTDNTSVLSSETHEKAALSGRLARQAAVAGGQLSQLVRRRSRGTFGVRLSTAGPRQVFPGQQSPSLIPPYLCCQGPVIKRSLCCPSRGLCGRNIGSGSGSGSCRNHVSPPGPGPALGAFLRRTQETRDTRHEARGAGPVEGFR